MCCSEIDSRAKKCPFCRHWQNKISLVLWHPTFAIAVILIFYILFQQFFVSQFEPGKDFNIDKGNIIIKDTAMEFGENKCGHAIVILGKIENNSNVSWRHPHFEIKFYDKNKNLVDTDQEEKYDFILPTKEEVPFKVSISRQFPEEQYNSFDIRIISASEKGFFF
jgi:hypothetical protein